MKARRSFLSMAGWFLAGAATVVAALALVGVVAAALSSPPSQQPPPPVPPQALTSTFDVFPPGFNPTPPATVFPPDFWAPRPWPTIEGTATAGTRVTTGGRSIQLPPNIYVRAIVAGEVDCFGVVCPPPGVWLGVIGGRSRIYVANSAIWNPEIAPGEEGVFDWLYQELGVAKGGEKRSR